MNEPKRRTLVYGTESGRIFGAELESLWVADGEPPIGANPIKVGDRVKDTYGNPTTVRGFAYDVDGRLCLLCYNGRAVFEVEYVPIGEAEKCGDSLEDIERDLLAKAAEWEDFDTGAAVCFERFADRIRAMREAGR